MRVNLIICVYILVMALVTYLIRMTPFVLFRKKIRSRFVRSVLYYLPYAVLSAMIIPAVFYSTDSLATALAGLIAAITISLMGHSLITVALGAAVSSFIVGLIINLI